MDVFWAYVGLFQFILLISVQAQRAPPGVPPQHYQPPPQQHYQQVHQQAPVQHVPMHQQQIPVQHQVPVQHVPVQQQQQQQQQVPVQQQVPIQQQVPVQQQQQQVHHHGQQILNTANIAHEKEHIAEHMEVPIDTSKMSEQELQFHYFKMHDADNNNKLDGCELIKSLIHWHEQGSKEKAGQIEDKIFKDEELITLIDPILNVDDSNRDGYIDYPEFVRAQQKAAGQGKPSSHFSAGKDKALVPVRNDDALEQFVDPLLQSMDKNNDGFVDYGEYRLFSGNTLNN